MLACALILNQKNYLSNDGVIYFNISSLALFGTTIFLTTVMWLTLKLPDFSFHAFAVWILTVYSNVAIISLDHLILILNKTHGVSKRKH